MNYACRYFLLSLMLVTIGVAAAQAQTGIPSFSSITGGPEAITLANLNSHFAVPVFQRPGRGSTFSYEVVYDSVVWFPSGVSGSQVWQPVANWGWGARTNVALSYFLVQQTHGSCTDPSNPGMQLYDKFSFVGYTDQFGTWHPVNLNVDDRDIVTSCSPTGNDTKSRVLTDGSGLTVTVYADPSGTVVKPDGTVEYPSVFGSPFSGADRNGNVINSNGNGQFYDTLSGTTPVLTVAGTGNPTSPKTFTYSAPAGNVSYTIHYATKNVKTFFNCSGVAEYTATGVSLVSDITLPDNSTLTLVYEDTPNNSGYVTGRIKNITLPTGGTITYAYTGGGSGVNGITCADGNPATLTRTLSDGAGWSAAWTYARTQVSGSHWQTIITDPSTSANQTVMQFQGIYLTKKQTYNGSAIPANLLKSIEICYNGAAPDCTATAVALPITQRAVYDEFPDSSPTSLQAKTVTLYNSFGLVTESDQYAFGTGAAGGIAKKTLVTYATLGGNVVSAPSLITVQNSAGAIVGQTSYSYDQFTVTPTSTPQHGSVSGPRANATTISSAYQTFSSLTRTYTYYDTGMVNTTTDPNGAITTYSYGGTGSCANAFVTGISLPPSVNLSESFTWNCTGGVISSATDVAGNTTNYQYTDPKYWRLNSITSPDQVVTTVSYPALNIIESYLNFNGNTSTVDVRSTADTLGRPRITQRRQGPGAANYDSYETDYDPLGRPNRQSIGYSAAGGALYSGNSVVSFTYDPLDRPLVGTDPGGGTISHAYIKNDVIETLGPAPSNEGTKVKQFEMDSLGHLGSVCEITSAAGSGSCGQTSGGTGFLSQYQFDLFGNLTAVTQNAQSVSNQQHRSFTRDFLGRITQEVTPESGTVNYTYDSQSNSNCSSTSRGDRVERVDAKGNATCYYYDQLHRLTKVTYAGPYASSTPEKHFVYDTATVNSVAMTNAGGRAAEAYTCSSPCTTKLTDIGFSYSKTGQLTDVYESTPSSNGYYHIAATFWESGMLKSLSGLPSPVPTINYSPDGQGRPTSVSGSDGSHYITSTTYNVDSNPSVLAYGTGDSDNYQYDPQTGRMNQYQFVGSSQSLTGALGWNANGSLKTQNITDTFNAADTQNCTYLYDDLSRVSSVNCPGVWSQTFGYDTFGNITKSGNGNFQPTYSSSTNQYTTLPGATPTYDLNGNLTYDGSHYYKWDAEGRIVDLDNGAITLIYSAFGNMVEQNIGGTVTEIVYGPSGDKLALMNGQTVVKAFIPLPAASKAVYTNSGLAYYEHADWLGSYRLATTPARTMYSDVAYAPFGEPYAQNGTPNYSFTGENQDTVQDLTTGLYDFPLRELSSTQGRWTCPDPAGLAAVDLLSPQTLNRYAYLANSPMASTDPSGLAGVSPCLLGAGITNMPPSHYAALFQQNIHAYISYPYQGQGFFKSLWSVIQQAFGFANSSTRILANDINFVISTAGTITDLVLYSGAAQSYRSALNHGLISDPSKVQNVIYLSPGCFGGDCVVNPSVVFHAHGIEDHAVTLFSRHASDISLACGHDLDCELSKLPQTLKDKLHSDCQIPTEDMPVPNTLEDPTSLLLASATGGGSLISLGPLKQKPVPNITRPPLEIVFVSIGGVIISIGVTDPCLFFPEACGFPPDDDF